MPPAVPLSLVADIGGTNTRVALADGPVVRADTIRRFANADYPGLETIVAEYLAEEGIDDLDGACAAAAGPVRDGIATMTNLDWRIDGAVLARGTKAEYVSILNDLQAQGHAISHLDPSAVTPIVKGPAATPEATALVVGVGTGFNAAPVFHHDGGYLVTPSECGHANMPIRTEAELRLCHFVETAHGFPAIEDVLAGRGIERIYSWLGTEAGEPAEKRSVDIIRALDDDSDPRATETAKVYTRLLGTVVGNLALIHLPFGGIYLIGGMARAMAPHLDAFGFPEAFRDKGRFAGFMDNFAISVVEDDYAALTGCASHLAHIISRG